MPVTQLDDSRVLLQLGTANTDNSVTVHLFGATIISWHSAGKERLFLSKTAILDGSKAIRGGIPLVFPQFGKASDPKHPYGQFPQHGFARNTRWWQEKTDKMMNKQFRSIFVNITEHDLTEEQRTIFPYVFRLSYLVTLTKADDNKESRLTTKLVIWNGEKSLNDGGRAFDYQALLHTYFHVPDITHVGVTGLSGQSYVDKVIDGTPTCVQDTAETRITGETDRVYQDVSFDHAVGIHNDHGPSIHMQREGGTDVVVWNPAQEKAAAMADLHPGAEGEFICVEVGHVRNYQSLLPGQTGLLSQTLSIEQHNNEQKL
ncbi:galactose mutarotase-like domain-containing protein [Syncephalis fuscata]|nr:galactose mutarotase-like domain-containing protein [Syncephalis fuscata]